MGKQRIDYSEAEQLLRAGATQVQVGTRFGVSQAAVSAAIRRGKIKWESPNQAEGRAVPWHPILEEHRNRYLVKMLRVHHRRSQGLKSAPVLEAMLDTFLVAVAREGWVVDYTPENGFVRVPRRPGLDKGLVREPDVDDRGWPAQPPE